MTAEIHQYDEGTVFEVEVLDEGVVLPIDTADVMQILFFKPSGAVVIKTAVHTTDGLDGLMEYTTDATDLDELKKWKIQGRVQFPTGKWSSDIGTFKVYPNLDTPE